MFYYLLKNPECLDELVREINTMDDNGELSDPITFAESNRMKYLQACMHEAMRMHPAVGQLLERLVPEGGANVAGVWLPGGTIVGVNPWVVSRDKSVYGADADKYRPERWLEADAASLKLMERNFLAVSICQSHPFPPGRDLRYVTVNSLFCAHSLDQGREHV